LKLRFQVKGQEYFLTFVEDERQWCVFAPTPAGMQRFSVYMDAANYERAGFLESGAGKGQR